MDAKTLLHNSLYDINNEADEVSKGSNNKKYRIVTFLATITIVDFALSMDDRRRGVIVLLVIAIAGKLKQFKYFGMSIELKFFENHEYAIYFI